MSTWTLEERFSSKSLEAWPNFPTNARTDDDAQFRQDVAGISSLPSYSLHSLQPQNARLARSTVRKLRTGGSWVALWKNGSKHGVAIFVPGLSEARRQGRKARNGPFLRFRPSGEDFRSFKLYRKFRRADRLVFLSRKQIDFRFGIKGPPKNVY